MLLEKNSIDLLQSIYVIDDENNTDLNIGKNLQQKLSYKKFWILIPTFSSENINLTEMTMLKLLDRYTYVISFFFLQ